MHQGKESNKTIDLVGEQHTWPLFK